jgi:short-subunit dehydrogenase
MINLILVERYPSKLKTLQIKYRTQVKIVVVDFRNQYRGHEQVNAENTTRIIHTVLPRMLKRNKSIIINIGSSVTLIPSSPLYTVYVATKAYVC